MLGRNRPVDLYYNNVEDATEFRKVGLTFIIKLKCHRP